jgi:hypothetical protein
MPSAIDETVPVFGTPTTASVRDNFAIAKAEITALQAALSGGVNSGTANQAAWYASTGSTVSGNANVSLVTGGGVIIQRNTAVLPPAITGTGVWVNHADTDTGGVGMLLDVYGDAANLIFRRANGTGAVRAPVFANNIIGALAARGAYDATNYSPNPTARVWFQATENFTAAAQGTRVGIDTMTPTTTNLVTRMQIGPGIQIGAPAGGDMGAGSLNATALYINGAAVGTATATVNPGTGPQIAQYPGGTSSVVGGVTLSGDATIAQGGALTIGALRVATGMIQASAVTYAKIQNVVAARLLGNPTGSAAAPSEITLGTNLTFAGSVLNAAGGASGLSGMTAGQIPIAATATTVTSSANLSGDITSNATLVTTLNPSVNSNVGTFQGLTVNGKGLVTAAANQGYLAAATAATTYLPLVGGVINGTAPGSITINRGTPLPPSPVGLVATLWTIGNTNENVAVITDAFGSGTAYMVRRANGTAAVPSALVATDVIGQLAWRGYFSGGTPGYSATIARVQVTALENFTNLAQGTQLGLATTAVGSTTLTTQALVGPGITVGTPTAPAGGMQVGDLNAQRIFVQGVATGGSTSPGGTTGQVQYHNGTTFGGSAGALFSASSLTAMNIALGSDGTGDLYYRAAGGALTRLGIGTPGQLLNVTAGLLPAWATVTTGTGTVSAGGSAGNIALYTGAAIVGPFVMSGDATISASGALTLANTATARTNIGLGTASSPTFTSLLLTGGTGSITIQRNGAALPPAIPGTALWVNFSDTDGGQVGMLLDSYANPGNFVFRRANGTGSARTGTLGGDLIGGISSRGYDGSAYSATGTARIWFQALQTYTVGAQGTAVIIETNSIGGTTPFRQARIGPGLEIGTPTAPAGGMQIGDVNATRLMVNGVGVATGGIPEAPADGISYGRNNSTWVAVAPLADTVSLNLTATTPIPLVLTSSFNEVSSVPLDSLVRFPSFMNIPGRRCRIAAYGANDLLVQPLSGQTIFAGGVSNGLDNPHMIIAGNVIEYEAATAVTVYMVSIT